MKSEILSHLSHHPWADTVQFFSTLPSTNTYAKQLAAQGAPEGTVVIADAQTAGRGRLGRSFDSPAGQGIWMSVILRPDCKPEQLMHLTCAAAVAACDAVERETGHRPGIKWINDLVTDGRKLAGILTELSIDSATGQVDYAVLGIGLNCNQQRVDFPEELRPIACSLAEVTGALVCRSRLIAALIRSFWEMRQALPRREQIMARYRQDCVTLNQEITVIQGKLRRDGVALSLSDDGALTVAYTDGTAGIVRSGEVSVRPRHGARS